MRSTRTTSSSWICQVLTLSSPFSSVVPAISSQSEWNARRLITVRIPIASRLFSSSCRRLRTPVDMLGDLEKVWNTSPVDGLRPFRR